MKREARKTLSCVALAFALLAPLAACNGGGDDQAGADDDDDDGAASGKPDAGGSTTNRDATTAQEPRDAAPDSASVDARTGNPSVDAATSSERDARVADAASSEGGAVDAANVGAGPRARACGDTRDFPSPFPSGQKTLTAAPVGDQRFGFVEGPVWVQSLGALLFSDMNFSGGDAKGPPSQIRRLVPPATYDVFVASSGSNGLALANDGNLLAATHDTQSLSSFDAKSGTRSDLTIEYQQRGFNSPNDLTVRSDGTVYFTDPDWQVGQRMRVMMGVYRVAPPLTSGADLSAELVDGMLDKPNGIALSPDEKTLYVGSMGNEVWKYTVASDGSVGGRTKFADVGGSDGMAVDCAGNLYVTSGTVEVFSPAGMKLGDIMTAESPSNAAFGGTDRKTLYVTAQSRVYSVALAVPGLPY